MNLHGYPENYVPRVDQVHPALQEVHAKLLQVAEEPTGLLKFYPILPEMLYHNLAFLGLRDLAYGHNIHGGVNVLIDMMHAESLEFQNETPIANRRKKSWKSVNGPASLEAVDVHFFGSLAAGMIEAGLGDLSEVDMLSFHLAMQQIQDVKQKSPGFDPYSGKYIQQVVHPDYGKNHSNYPIVANKAKGDWEIPTMAMHYKTVAKPRQRELRDEFDGGKLPKEVAESINRLSPDMPMEYATPIRIEKYKALYEVIYKG